MTSEDSNNGQRQGLRYRMMGLLSAFVLLVSCSTAESEPSHGFLTIGEDQLYYEVSGSGEPIVFISGGSGMDLRQWDAVFPAFEDEFQTIRLDPRGIGKSDNPTATYSDADDVDALFEHLGLEKAHVVSLSSSGGLALEFAVRFPEHISTIVVSSPFLPSFEFNNEMMARLGRFNEAAGAGREPFLDVMFEDPHFFPSPLDPSVREAARANMGMNYDKGADYDFSLLVQIDPPLINQLSSVRAPTLLLAGELDHPEVHRRQEFIQEQIEGSQIQVVPDSGHNPQLENPQVYTEIVMKFLDANKAQ